MSSLTPNTDPKHDPKQKARLIAMAAAKRDAAAVSS